MPRRLIIDCDPGVGDALALIVAMSDPALDVVGVTAVAGAVSGEVATRNIQAIIEQLDPRRWPRVGACTSPSAGLPPAADGGRSNVSALHGGQGLGDLQIQVADLHNPRDSARLLTDLVREFPHEITLLTLGPLTNVALACDRMPDFLDHLAGLVCCGGAVAAGGDITAAAEFNIWADPEAATQVLNLPAARTLVPLDISLVPLLTYEAVSRLRKSLSPGLEKLLPPLLSWQLRVCHEQLGLEGARIPELAALAVVAAPQYASTTSMLVDVETSGRLTRGMTVFDRRGIDRWQTNIDVVDDLDSQGVVDYLTRVLVTEQS